MSADWSKYQEAVAEFFRELGISAETNVTVTGIRTNHDVDVLVTSIHKGISLKWVVECKLWQRPVTKLNVLALRTIVDDVGADRGFILSESGYQKGAREAAYLSNIQLTSLEDLSETCGQELAMMRARKLYLRAQEIGERYWSLSKQIRIDYGLRPDVGGGGFSGDRVVNTMKLVLLEAIFYGFPVIYNEMEFSLGYYSRISRERATGDLEFETPEALTDFVADKLDEVEDLLIIAEASRGSKT